MASDPPTGSEADEHEPHEPHEPHERVDPDAETSPVPLDRHGNPTRPTAKPSARPRDSELLDRRRFLGRAGVLGAAGMVAATGASAVDAPTGRAESSPRGTFAADVSSQQGTRAGTDTGTAPDAAEELPVSEQPILGAGGSDRASMAFFKGRLDSAHSPCVAVAMGDSITEGYGVRPWPVRYLTRLQDRLRLAYPFDNPDPGVGYVPATFAHNIGEPTRERGTTMVDAGGGLGNRRRLVPQGGWVEWPRTRCDRIWVHHGTIAPGVAIPEFGIEVDGRPVRAVSTAAAAGPRSGVRTEVTLADGAHTVRVTGLTGTSSIEGVTFLRGRTGLYLLDASHSGYRATSFIGERARGHWQAVADLDPVMLTCMLGANDMGADGNRPAKPEDWASSLRTLVDTARRACPRAGLFFFHWTARHDDPEGERLRRFEQAAYAAIGADPRVSFHLLSRDLPPGSDDSLDWHLPRDVVHPNAWAHAYLADRVARAIIG